MRRGPTFRWGRTRPADGQSNNSETLSRIQSLADYTIDTLESSFRKRQGESRPQVLDQFAHRIGNDFDTLEFKDFLVYPLDFV